MEERPEAQTAAPSDDQLVPASALSSLAEAAVRASVLLLQAADELRKVIAQAKDVEALPLAGEPTRPFQALSVPPLPIISEDEVRAWSRLLIDRHLSRARNVGGGRCAS